MKIQVVYALPDAQFVKPLELVQGATLEQALIQSGVCQAMGLDQPFSGKVGIWGKVRPLDTVLKDGDRIELYRPRLADPKEARRKRV